MKIKKNTFSTLVLELFFPSIANCKKFKIQKSTSPYAQRSQFSFFWTIRENSQPCGAKTVLPDTYIIILIKSPLLKQK
jgi:hypothetical protein